MAWRDLRTPRHEAVRQLIIDRRLRARLTQTEVAKRLERPQSYVSAVERGSHRVTIVEFLEFAEVLDFDAPAAIRRILKSGQPTPTPK
jgi:transcriptional regulator with XRE-family HTH domain